METDNKQSNWYYIKQGKQIGPVSKDEIINCIKMGFLTSGDMVQKQGITDWITLTESNLKSLSISPPPSAVIATPKDELNNEQAEWYYEKDGKQIGPLARSEIVASIETGFLSYGTMVWRRGSPGWVKLEDSALKHLLGNVPPPLSTKPVQQPKLRTESQFEQTSILLMIFLTIITLGIYGPVWFLRRKDAINSLQAREKLNPDIFTFVIILQVIGLLLSFWGTGKNISTAQSIELISSVLSWIIMITVIVQCFKVRRIFDEHFNIRLRKYIPFSGLATFFFGIFYLQYEINRFDLRSRL